MAFLGNAFFYIRIAFIIIDVALVVAFVYILTRAIPFRPKLDPAFEAEKKTFTLQDAITRDRWSEIIAKVDAGSPELLKLAIIEADKLADDTLKRLGFEGKHMADRMQNVTPETLRSFTGLWKAHRVRNSLVHTPGYEVSKDQAVLAIESYRKFLAEVKAL